MASRREGDGPAWAARRLLRLLVPEAVQDEIEGDLVERYGRIRAREGRAAANRWIWRQIAALRPLALRRAVQGARGRRHGRTTAGGERMGSGWLQDLRSGVRALRARPAASLTVALTVALAIGATTAVFTVVNGVLLRPLPFPEPERLVRIWQTNRAWLESPNSQLRNFARRFPVSAPTFNDWTEEGLGFAALGAYADRSYVHQGPDGATMLQGQAATSGVFAALGTEPLLGRPLRPAEDRAGAPRVAVLAYGLWQERFGGDRGVLGGEIVLDGAAHEIVGVMPPDFRPATGSARVWAPLTDEEKGQGRNSQFLSVVGRLSPGVSLETAAGRLEGVQAALAEAYPDSQGDLGSRVQGLLEATVGSVSTTLWFLLGAVGLVLLIGCVNIANLLSVVGLERRRELAVKAALGASPWRLVRSLLMESGLLAGIGGLAGIALAWASLPLMLRLVPPSVPRQEAIGMDALVLLFGLTVTALTALLVGTLPALQVTGADPTRAMKASAPGTTLDRSGSRIRSALVVTEVALAFVLLLGAGLLGTSFARLLSVDPGLTTEGLVFMSVYPDPGSYPERDDRDRFLSTLRERLAAIPGVRVSATSQVPLSGETASRTHQVERADRVPEDVNVLTSAVLENYFDVARIPVRRGRALAAADDRDAPRVAVVNESMARAVWPGESALGKRLRSGQDEPWITVVGVVGDVRHQSLTQDPEPKLYIPAWQTARYPSEWVLRARGGLGAVMELARQAVEEISPATPVRETRVLEEEIAASVAVPRFRTFLIVGLAAMAGVLALLGVFGIVSLSVTHRMREIGVRVALGAPGRAVVRGVVASGLKLAAGGIFLGLVMAIPARGLVDGFLFGIEPTDPGTWAGVVLGLTLVSGVASYLPARRAAGVDPVVVLKSE